MRALLVVNPKATATSSRTRDVLAHALASETRLDVEETKRRGHAVELGEQAVAEGYDVVVALGGDGTVNEVVNGLLASGPGSHVPAFAVVPGGNANVFARALGLPDNAVEATSQLLDALREERRRTVGLGRADERWFTFCAGFGLDAEVVRKVEHKRSDGRKATPGLFVRTAVQHFFTRAERRHGPITLELEGREPERLAVALICNTNPWTYLGPRPVQPCPEARFELGLDLFGLRRMPTVPTLRLLTQILSSSPRVRGRHVVTLHDVDGFVLRGDRPLPLQVDGDDLGDAREVRFRAVPAALDVVV